MSEYNPIAYYYDLEYSQISSDLDFYREMARQVGAQARILELACGTGRVALPLLRAGFRVTGLDNSAQMVEMARQKLAIEPDEVRKRGSFIEADMRDFHLKDEQFDLIFIALNSFQHLLTQADQLSFLRAVRRHLAPAGLFILDTFNPEDKENYPTDGRLELNASFLNPQTGGKVHSFLSTTANPAEQQRHHTYFYDETAPDGSIKRTITSFKLRYTYRYEMELLLDKAGFAIEEFYGSSDFDDFVTGSAKLIYVCRRG